MDRIQRTHVNGSRQAARHRQRPCTHPGCCARLVYEWLVTDTPQIVEITDECRWTISSGELWHTERALSAVDIEYARHRPTDAP
jgi:hypothetical protein